MKNQNYKAPRLEQVRTEAEMPVMAGSGSSVKSGNVAAMSVGGTGVW